ncbi:MAG: glycoside hydrolase family 127 protein [Verrucomicrobia bacterium]|nr:glycoside hydrolase family 127 protein [Verrucomicrobiota bacterium]
MNTNHSFALAAVALTLGVLPTCADSVAVVARPNMSGANPFYPGNKEPLLASPYIRLPLCAVKPQGWLLKQLQLQAAGFHGHLGEISGFLNKQNNAWLNPEGKGDCFWEEVPYWLRGYAASAFLLDEPKLVAEAKAWLEPSIIGQRPNGYFGTAALAGLDGQSPDLMPHLNMMYAYRSYYDYSGDQRVLELLTKFFHYELTLEDKRFFSGGWGVSRNSDNMDMVYWLYNRTGDPKLLELGEKLMRTGQQWMDRIGGGHNVQTSQGFRKPAVFYQQNKDPKYLGIADSNWTALYDQYGQVPGGMFGGDEFARPGYGDPKQAIETCGAVEMMFSEQMLFRITGDLKWMDRCENIAFNTFPATMTANYKALRYLTSPNQCNSDARSKAPSLANDGEMQVMNPRDHRCCQHNVGVGWPHFVESLYQATPDRGLAAVMYAPCTVTARVGDGTKVMIEEVTKYPFEESIQLKLKMAKGVGFPLYLRIPAWCDTPSIKLNGKPATVAAKGGQLVCVSRTWQDGDTLTLELPMSLKLTRWEKNQRSVSVNRGPLTYSIKIGEKYVRRGNQDPKAAWPAWEIVPTSPWNYGLVVDAAKPEKTIALVRKPWPADEQPFALESAPLELQASARRIPNWGENYWGTVDRLQPSPVKVDTKTETITMIPMGAARLRMAALPVIGDGPDARPWTKYQEPVSSWSEDVGILKTITDASDPKSSRGDGKCFLMYGSSLGGSKQWITMPFDQPRTLSKSRTYWMDEQYPNGGVRVPASITLFYQDGGAWKPVPNAKGLGCAMDQYNEATFDPVTTTAIRMEMQFQPTRCGGLMRWRLE